MTIRLRNETMYTIYIYIYYMYMFCPYLWFIPSFCTDQHHQNLITCQGLAKVISQHGQWKVNSITLFPGHRKTSRCLFLGASLISQKFPKNSCEYFQGPFILLLPDITTCGSKWSRLPSNASGFSGGWWEFSGKADGLYRWAVFKNPSCYVTFYYIVGNQHTTTTMTTSNKTNKNKNK